MELLETRRLLAGVDEFGLPPAEGESDGGFVPGEVLIRFRDGITEAEKQALVDDLGLEIKKEYRYVNSALLGLPDDVGVPTALLQLRQDDRVDVAEPNSVIQKRQLFPNDTLFGQQWDKNNTGSNPGVIGGVADADIDAPEAWEQFGTGSSDTVIAIFDTGVNYEHEDLFPNMWRNPGEIPNGRDDDGNGYIDDIYGYDFADQDPDPMDEDGHGTHVAGIAGAVGNNGLGVAGVNWDTSIMAIRILDGDVDAVSAAIEGINYTIMMKKDYGVNLVAANHSWGFSGISDVLQSAFEDAISWEIIQVAAAGNDNQNNDAIPDVPSGFPIDGLISVAATDPADDLAIFSNYGVTTVDIGAPGVDITSTVLNDGYDVFQGTSMASPQVAGAVAYLKSIAPELTVDETIDLIYRGADPLPSLEGWIATGARLNIWESAKLLKLSTLSGRVWADVDGDGQQDTMESGLSGWTVYIDLNNNKIFDTGEPSTVSGNNGVWAMSEFLDPGTYSVRVEPLPQYDQTFPGGDGSHSVTIEVRGEDFENLDFGFRGRPGEISGVKFNDLNGNGVQDPGEPGIAGVYIYADLDQSGSIALGEPAAITDAQGRYRLTGVPAATINVREVLSPGWRQTAPGVPEYRQVDVKPGDVITDINFGNQVAIDYGDAPTPYPETASAGFLRGFGLGTLIDTEPNALPDDDALGDDNNNLDDEDGVSFPNQLYVGQTVSIDVRVSTGTSPAGVLQGWIDFNGDGDWSDPGEQVFKDLALAAGVYSLDVAIPSDAQVGSTFARFRYGYERGIGPDGAAMAGEVEDYQITIVPDAPTAVPDSFTVAQGSTFNTLDVLANDFASSQGGLFIDSVTAPDQGGTLTIADDKQSLVYSPLPNFFSPPVVTFQYTISDNSGEFSSASVTVFVQATFTSPVAVDDVAYVEPDSFVVIPVLENDLPDGITLGAISPPQFGTAVQVGDQIRYTPGPNFTAVDQFQYQIVKGNESDTATVTVFKEPEPPKDVTITIELVDDQGAPVTQVTAGDEFYARVRVQDTRQPADAKPGVAAMYMDLLFDRRYVTTIADANNPFGFDITFNTDAYDTLLSGSAAVPGLIDEVGGFQTGLDPLGASAIEVFTVGLRAVQATPQGEPVMFYGDPADAPQGLHDILLYNPPSAATVDRVSYGTASLVVVADAGTTSRSGETGPGNTNGNGGGTRGDLDVSGDGILSPLDVLLVINYLNSGGGSGEGEPSDDRYDVNDDGIVSPLDALVLISALNDPASSSGEGEAAPPLTGRPERVVSDPVVGEDSSESSLRRTSLASIDARDYLLQVGLPQARQPRRDEWSSHREEELEDLLDVVAGDVDRAWS